MTEQEHKTHLTRFATNLWISFALIIGMALGFAIYAWSEKQVEITNKQRYLSRLLAEELRQSSDDLTRMIRTYVITGDPIYKQYYQDILDIRNGKKPRPEGYENIYWDFMTSSKEFDEKHGTQIALLDMMMQAGFTEPEFLKLKEAKVNSDALTATEFEAMRLIETASLEDEDARSKARIMLHDEKYHLQKASIMKPINDFFILLDERTSEAVHIAARQAAIFRYLCALMGLVLMFMLWRSYNLLHTVLGGSIDDVYLNISKIGAGDFTSDIKVAKGMENSVMGWLSETRERLDHLDSDRKKSEIELSVIGKRLQSIIGSAGEGIYGVDTEGKATFVNPALERMVGYSSVELVGALLHALLHHTKPDGSPHPVEECQTYKVFKTGVATYVDDDVFWKKDGSAVSVAYASSPLFDDVGKILGAVVMIRDITEHKRAEEELRLHQFHLERLVEERTVQLKQTHEKFVHAEKLSALGKLTGSIAHEFNNPLFGVRNIVEQALEQLAHDKEFNPLLTLALKECDRMADMIRRLQGFYRPSDNIRKRVDIHQALDDTALLLKNQLKTNKTELKKNYSPGLPEVYVVEDQMKQVFLNLLQNANDAIPHESGTITVTTESPDGNTLKISIEDTGEGIPPETLKLIFDPFFSTRAIKGTGLGLSVCHGIIKAHGGDIQVKSEPGKGTIFTINLPVEYSVESRGGSFLY